MNVLIPTHMNNNDTALFAIPAILLLLLLSFSSPSVTTMAQQQTTGATTTTMTPTPPLTPQEQEHQNRLQNVIAATNQNLDEAEKEVNGIVYTPRWSEPVWVNANSLAVLIAYCLPGEFAESGQEILGGFELEILESYEIALPQGFMAWMMVVGNEDRQDRLPAAVGVVCASDLNEAETRVVSPQEQQEINNVVSQFTTQVTNIEQVINIINNNVTTPAAPAPPQNDTGGLTEQPLTVEIIPNATQGIVPTYFGFEAKVTGGTAPYTYSWGWSGNHVEPYPYEALALLIDRAVTMNVFLTVTDSKNQTASDSVQVTVREPGGVAPPPPPPTNDTGDGGTPPPGGGGGGLPGPRVPGGGAGVIPENATAEADRTPPSFIDVPPSWTFSTDNPEGFRIVYNIPAMDDVDGYAMLEVYESTTLHQDNVGGDITISCSDPPPGL